MAALASSSYSSLVGWSGSSFVGAGLERKAARRAVQLQRRGQGIRAAPAAEEEEEEEPNFFQNLGTQFFKVGGTKVESAPSKGGKSGEGTQFFGIGGTRKKKAAAAEVEEPKKGGTQLFNFGTQVKKAGGGTTTNGSALAVRKGTTALESLPFGRGRRVDPKTVFVAGATGQIGARISQQLLRAGFSVRGGVPDLYVAQQLAEFATQYGVISRDEAKRLNAVEFDFKNVSSIAKALGNAGKVVVSVGPTEDGPLGKVTRDDALRVLEAATLSNAAHFILVSEPGTGVSADNGPLAGLAALFSRVFSKASEVSESELVDKIVETGLPYTIIKAGSTDGVDDYAPESGNLVVEAEGAADPSAKVSKIQIASVVAGVFQYTGISENKFFEVSSSPYAPSRPVDELLSAIQVDGRRELLEEERARLAAEEKEREARLQAEAEAEEAIKEAREASQFAAQLEAEAKRLAAEETKAAAVAARAQAKADAAAASVDGLQEKAKELGGSPLKTIAGRLGSVSFKLDDSRVKKAAASVEEKVKKPAFSFPKKVQRVEEEVEEKVKKPAFSFPKKVQRAAPQPAVAAASAAPKSGGFFGGLFAPQETIYVDED